MTLNWSPLHPHNSSSYLLNYSCVSLLFLSTIR